MIGGGENVPQENNDDVVVPDVALHEAVTQPMATVNDAFRNTRMALISCYVMYRVDFLVIDS
jgi:hypothetical protein